MREGQPHPAMARGALASRMLVWSRASRTTGRTEGGGWAGLACGFAAGGKLRTHAGVPGEYSPTNTNIQKRARSVDPSTRITTCRLVKQETEVVSHTPPRGQEYTRARPLKTGSSMGWVDSAMATRRACTVFQGLARGAQRDSGSSGTRTGGWGDWCAHLCLFLDNACGRRAVGWGREGGGRRTGLCKRRRAESSG